MLRVIKKAGEQMSKSLTQASKKDELRFKISSILTLIAALVGFNLAPMAAFAIDGEVTVNCSISGGFKVLTQGSEVTVHSGNTCRGIAEIPAEATKVGGFANNPNLSSIVFLGENVRSIENLAFYSTGLTSIVIPASVVTIGSEAFIHSQLTSVTFGQGSRLQSIGQSAFAANQALTQVTLPASLTTIGNYAFRYNRNLQSLTFEPGSQLVSIADFAFHDTRVTSVSLSSTVQTFTLRAFVQGSKIDIASDNPYLVIQNGVLFSRDMTKVFGYPTTFTASSYVIPSTVTRIEGGAFEQAQFTSVLIPDSVTYIGGSAFNISRLTSVRIPASVTTLEIYAFNDNPNLASVVFAPGSNLTTIKYKAFQSLPSLTTLDFGAGSRLTTIVDGAFYGSGLTSVTLPASLEYLEAEAFRASTRLSTVSFEVNSRIKKIGTSAFSNTALSVSTPKLPNLPSNPVRTGYSFAGWSLTDGGAVVQSASSKVVQGSAIYALWNVAPTVTSGSVTNSQVVSIPSGLRAAEVPATANLPAVNLAFTPTSSSAVVTLVPIDNPASAAATPFIVTGSTKIVDIQVSGISGDVTVCLDGAPTDELFHYTGGAWVALPQRTYANGQVCGVTDSFSPFTAAELAPPPVASGIGKPLPTFEINSRIAVSTFGQSLRLNGQNLDEISSVTVGGKALKITKKTENELVLEIPAGREGYIDMEITHARGFMALQGLVEAVKPYTLTRSIKITKFVGNRPTIAGLSALHKVYRAGTTANILNCVVTVASDASADAVAKAESLAKATCQRVVGYSKYIKSANIQLKRDGLAGSQTVLDITFDRTLSAVRG
jgi:hypothetical protein